MATNAVTAGHAYVVIGAKKDSGSFGKVLGSIRGTIDSFGATLQRTGGMLIGLGSAIQAPLVAAASSLASWGDGMAKAAKRANVTSSAFSELAHVATLSGAGAQEVELAFKKMAQAIYNSSRGMKQIQEAFGILNLRVEDLQKLTPEEQFTQVADALSKVQDASTRTGLAMQLFGRSGTKLMPMIMQGAEGIQHYREEARRLGVSLSTEQAGAAELLTDMLARLNAAWQGLSNTVGQIVIPRIVQTITYMTNLVANFREYLANNPQIVASLQSIAYGLVGIGTAMVTIGTASKALSVLVSPGGALAVLAAVLLYVSGTLDDVIDKWKDTVLEFEFGGVKVRDVIEAIRKAIDSLKGVITQIGSAWGRITPVFEAIGRGLKAAFMGVIEWLRNAWASLMVYLISSIRSLITNLYDELYAAWSKAGPGLGKIIMGDTLNALNLVDLALRKSQFANKDFAAGGKGLPEQWFGIAGRAFGEAGGGASGLVKELGPAVVAGLKGAADALGEPVKKVLDSILGEKSGPIKGFFDIFKGLGDKFKEFFTKGSAPALATASPEARAALSAQGTFFARQAAQMTGPTSISQTQLKQLSEVIQIKKMVKQAMSEGASIVYVEE